MASKKQKGLAAELAKAVLSKQKNILGDKYSHLGKELINALNSGDSAQLGKLLRDQVGIAVADAMRQTKDGSE